jgi:hypothetical protein
MNTPSRIVTPERRSDAQGFGPKTVLVFLIFAGAGPFIGGLIVKVAVWFFFGTAPQDSDDFRVYHDIIETPALVSYVFGGLQASFVAVVAAIFQVKVRTGFVPFFPILVASVFAGVVAATVVQGGNLGIFGIAALLVVIAFHAFCGMLCWLICTALLWPFRPRPGNQVTA